MNKSPVDLERLRAALAASGDVAYDWSLATDELTWLDGNVDSFMIPGGPTLSTGEAFNERVHPEDHAHAE